MESMAFCSLSFFNMALASASKQCTPISFIKIIHRNLTRKIQISNCSHLTNEKCHNTYKLDEGGDRVMASCPDLTNPHHQETADLTKTRP
jgi:hypothetical protein